MNSTSTELARFMISDDVSIKEAIRAINDGGIKMVLVIDVNSALVGTISDGDIRRAILNGLSLADGVGNVIHRNPLVATRDTQIKKVLALMEEFKVSYIPILDHDKKVIGMHSREELNARLPINNIMIIMAGGMGKRMLPFTEKTPKPMLSVAGKPMLEHILIKAKSQGFNNFIISINHLGKIIEDYFGDGKAFGVSIKYIKEVEFLGTAGALSLIDEKIEEPFIVTNGDVICDLNYKSLLEHHIDSGLEATMAVRLHEIQHPFGVVELEEDRIIGFKEKPVIQHYVNAGIYALNPSTLSSLGSNEYCDMPSLFELTREKCGNIGAYLIHEPWFDVGRPDDLHLVNLHKGTSAT